MSFVSHCAEALSALNNAASRALEICGGIAETYAKQLCPVKTGNLRNSITHAQQDKLTEVTITVAVPSTAPTSVTAAGVMPATATPATAAWWRSCAI